MRILIVTQYFWPEVFRINDLAFGLREQGHSVTVLTGIPNYPSGKFFKGYHFGSPHQQNYYGVNVLRVPIIPRGSGRSFNLIVNYLSFVLFSFLMIPIYCREKYDVIFVFQTSPVTVALPAILIKKLKKIPLYLWVQDLWPESLSAVEAVKSPFILSGIKRLVRFIYRQSDTILISSRGFYKKILEVGGEDQSPKIRYFPNWAESLYQPVAIRDAAIKKEIPDGFIIMFAGNIGAAQSIETVIAAANKLKDHPDICWVIVGEGRRFEEAMQMARGLKLEKQIRWLGRKPLERMPHYFAYADALLVTLRRNPIFSLTVPSKIQSYLACGKPIIAALDGEGGRIIKEAKAGLAVPAEDAGALANAVLALYRMSPEERNEMGNNGHHYFLKNFNREKLLPTLIQWMSLKR